MAVLKGMYHSWERGATHRFFTPYHRVTAHMAASDYGTTRQAEYEGAWRAGLTASRRELEDDVLMEMLDTAETEARVEGRAI